MSYPELPLEVDMPDVYREWLLWLPAYKNKSSDTLRAYGQGLRRMLLHADIPPVGFRPQDLTQDVLTEAVRRMRAALRRDAAGEDVPAVSTATIHTTLAAVNSFFDYCLCEGLIAEAPDVRRIRKISRLKRSEVDPEYFRPSEVRDLYETAKLGIEGSRVHWPVRDLAMCSFLAVMGLRASELCNANLDWIIQEHLLDDGEHAVWMIRIEDKGGKIRRLPLSTELIKVVEDWQEERATRFGLPLPDDPLFVTHEDSRFNYQRLHYWFRTLNAAAALRRRPLHSLRHTAGVQLANNGVPMYVIQKFLGHANVATTGIYTELAGGELAAGGELLGVLNRSEGNTLLREVLDGSTP